MGQCHPRPRLSIVALCALALLLSSCSNQVAVSEASPPTAPPVSFADLFPQGSASRQPVPAASPGPAVNVDPSGVLRDPNGFTLYTYDSDGPNQSNCAGPCTADFKPLMVPSASALSIGAGLNSTDLSTITRADGSIQVTYRGHPIYTYAGDENHGDMLGDGIGGVWHTARQQ